MTTYHRSGYGESNSTFALVTINGTEISKKHGLTIHIHQSMLEHTIFELHCPSEAFSDKITYPLKNSIKLLGTDITVLFRKQGGNESLFTGFVTHVSYKKNNKYPFIVICGKSYSALLDSQKTCRTFHNKTLQDILKATFSEYTGPKIDFICQPNKKEIIPYTVSYNETAYEFIQRLAKRYGEFLFWNGHQLIFGRGNQKIVKLKEGRDYLEYRMDVGIAPQHLIYENYNHQVAEVQSQQSKPAGTHINLFQEKAVDIAHKVYTQLPSAVYYDTLSEEQSTVQEQKLEAHQKALENLVIITAQTTHAKLRLGDIAKMLAYIPEFERQKETGTPIESYLITQIEHTYTTKGYTNKFTAIPKEQEIAPYWDMKAYPIAEDQSAVVMENNDPLKQNRIKVQFYWQKLTNQTTPWIRLIQGLGGNGQGMHLIPEIGHEVQIAFIGNNAEIPLVTGSLYNGKQNSGYSSQNNDLKVLHTRSGTKRIANDAEGSILEQDAAGSFIKWKGDGKLQIKAEEITIDATDIYFNIANQMVHNIIKRLFIFTPFLKQYIPGFMQVFSHNTLISSKEKLDLQSRSLIAAGMESILIHSDKKATINSMGKAQVKGEQGNDLNNTPEPFQPQPDENIALAVVQFRYPKQYNAWYGYDWLRLNESSLTERLRQENAYKKTIIGGIEKVTEDLKTKKVVIKKYSDNNKAYEALEKEYEQIEITRNPNYQGNEKTYFVPYLKLYSKEFSDKQKNNPPHPFKAGLIILNEVMEEIETVEAELDGITKFSDKTLINITFPTGELFINKAPHDKKDEGSTILITCNRDFDQDKDLNFYAYPKGKISKADRRLIGRIKLCANSERVRKDIKTLLIPVRTDITGTEPKTGKITNGSDQFLTKILNQAFITPKIENYKTNDQPFFDLSNDPDFKTGGKYIDHENKLKIKSDNNSSNLNENQITEFVTDIENKFLTKKDENGNHINEKYKDYFLVFIFGVNSNYKYDLYGFIKNINEKRLVLLKLANEDRYYGGLCHEFLHGLGLFHTFSEPFDELEENQKYLAKNQKYFYPAYNIENSEDSTDNIMSYTPLRTNLWHWQTKIINPDIK